MGEAMHMWNWSVYKKSQYLPLNLVVNLKLPTLNRREGRKGERDADGGEEGGRNGKRERGREGGRMD